MLMDMKMHRSGGEERHSGLAMQMGEQVSSVGE